VPTTRPVHVRWYRGCRRRRRPYHGLARLCRRLRLGLQWRAVPVPVPVTVVLRVTHARAVS
jgi:hypothetical protein